MCGLVVEYEFYGAVVAAENLVVNGGRSHFVGKTVAHKEIVDTPPRILLARTEAVTPPRIGIGEVGVEEAETVGEPSTQQGGHFLAFLIGETGIFAVGFRIFQVNLLVRHIQVAAHNHRFLGIKSLQVGAKIVLPRHAVVEAAQTVLTVGRVASHEVEIRHFERDHTSLVVVLINAQAVGHAQRSVLGENRRSAVAFLVGIVPVRLIAVESQIELTGLHLRFLQTEEIGIERSKDFGETFAHHRAKSVHIPRNEFHIIYFLLYQFVEVSFPSPHAQILHEPVCEQQTKT